MRFAFFFIALLHVGAALAQPNPDEIRRTLVSQAEAVRRAMLDDDHPKMVDLTHPKLVEGVGGREKMIRMLETAARNLNSKGLKRSVTMEKPSELAAAGDEWFGIVPFELELAGPERRESAKSFLVAVSGDGGKSWKFIDAGRMDRARLKRLLPNFPTDLHLPGK
jgi:hypothetical protein